jgi:hypothetical protein
LQALHPTLPIEGKACYIVNIEVNVFDSSEPNRLWYGDYAALNLLEFIEGCPKSDIPVITITQRLE